MLYFPQLLTGAIGQFPLKRLISRKTIANLLEDGSRVTLSDPGAATTQWTFTFVNLSDDEADELAGFFHTMEGRLNNFTLLDPVGNLLAWSEDLTQSIWQKNSLLQLTAGIADPLGTTRACQLTNTSAGDLTLVQTISVPGTVTCCFSCHLRSDLPQLVSLTRVSGPVMDSTFMEVGSDWRLSNRTSQLANSAMTSDFGVTIKPGMSLDVFGLQIQAQPAASLYVRTAGSGGIYPAARFDSDTLAITSTAPNRNACTVTLITEASE